MKVFFDAHSLGSKGCKTVSKATGIKRITGKHVKKDTNFYIEWGQMGYNKLEQLHAFCFNGIPTLEYTESKNKAKVWVDWECTVFVRTLLRASKGKGIIVVEPEDGFAAIPDAPLYTRGFHTTEEFRVHLVNGTPVLVTQKRKKNGVPKNKVRSHENGYVQCINNIDDFLAKECRTYAMQAWEAVGKPHIAAVDIAYNNHDKIFAVLEVNTAPGVCSPSTTNAYRKGIQQWMSELGLAHVLSAEAKTTDTPSTTDIPTVSDATHTGVEVTKQDSIPSIGKVMDHYLDNSQYVGLEYYQKPLFSTTGYKSSS